MSTYQNQLEAHRDAVEMERHSILDADDGLWPCSGKGCDNRVENDGDYCETCQADIEYYANDED